MREPKDDVHIRLRDRPVAAPEDASEVDLAATLFREAAAPRIATAQVARVFHRLTATRVAGTPMRGGLRWKVAAGVLGVSTASLAAYLALTAPARREPAPDFHARPVPEQVRFEAPGAGGVAAVIEPMPAPAQADKPGLHAYPAHKSTASRASIRKPATIDDGLERETMRLAPALAKLRRAGDAAAAVREIDAYLAEFPNGMLVPEAKIARVDALVKLGRKRDALTALQDMRLDGHRRGLELKVLRAELASERDCRAAIADFSAIRSEAPADLFERSLRGRGLCWLRLGDQAAAHADFDEYLRRFPDGRFAAEARSHL